MNKKKKKSKKVENPTLFVFEGSIRCYQDGSMLQLYTSIQSHEWELIVEETIKYQIFLECLKSVAFPILNEKWTKEDDWFRLQLDIAVSRMRNIDPLLVMKWNVDDIKKKYTDKMNSGATEVKALVNEMKQQQRGALNTRVSDL